LITTILTKIPDRIIIAMVLIFMGILISFPTSPEENLVVSSIGTIQILVGLLLIFSEEKNRRKRIKNK